MQEGDAPFTMGTAKWSKVRRKKASSVAKYSPYLQTPGRYAVYVSYQTLQNSISDAHYVVVHKGVETHFTVNQTMGGGTWVYLGTFDFGSGDGNYVAVDNVSKMKGVVTTDAVRFGGGMGNTERGGSVSGYLLLDSKGVRTHGKGAESTDPWLNGFETGVTDRDAIITSITKFLCH